MSHNPSRISQPDPGRATTVFWAWILGSAKSWIGGVVCRLSRILIAPDRIECRTRSLSEAAAELGLSEITVRRLLSRGKLRRLENVGRVRITRESIDHYLRGTP